MSERLQPARGTQDLLPETQAQFRGIENLAWQIASTYGYEEIDTPIFEFSEVFHRTLGETSDAVSKETYTFTDRGGESLTLRPEGTAGIARAFLSNGLQQKLPLKFYYSGPMFRYERPQKGRYRQFHQVGVESLGQEAPLADVECIALGYRLLCDLGLGDKVQLEINSLGDSESRGRHRDLLVEYLSKFESELSADSQVRLKKNPLRILDSKDAGDRKILEGAPRLDACLNDTSKAFFDSVLAGLAALNIPFVHQKNLVRGFDYYTHSVFEFTTGLLGAQSAVVAGGRYNGLISLMGGNDTPGVGWAAGLERLALLVDQTRFTVPRTDVAVASGDDSLDIEALQITEKLRAAGLITEFIYGGNLGKKMKKASRFNAKEVLIFAGDEKAKGLVSIKNMETGEQKQMSLDSYLTSLKR